jgi:hypothetical protein
MCSSKGIFKRVVPFLITLIIGLFIASFFVDLAPRRSSFAADSADTVVIFKTFICKERDRRERAERELDRMRQNPTMLVHPQPWTAQDDFVPPGDISSFYEVKPSLSVLATG